MKREKIIRAVWDICITAVILAITIYGLAWLGHELVCLFLRGCG